MLEVCLLLIILLIVLGERTTTKWLYKDCVDRKCDYCNKKDNCKFEWEV